MRKRSSLSSPRLNGQKTVKLRSEEQSWRALMASVLCTTLSDAKRKDRYGDEAFHFVRTKICAEMCSVLDLDYGRYREEFRRRREKA